MKQTMFYEKYPATIWRAALFLLYITVIKTCIELGVGVLAGVYLGIYTAVTGQDFNLLLESVNNTINLSAVTISDLTLISILLFMMKKRRQEPLTLRGSLESKPNFQVTVSALLGVFAVSMAGGLLTQGITNLFQTEMPEHIEAMMAVEEVLSLEFALTIIAVVFAAPIFEEFLLRKLMMDGLLKKHKPVTVIFVSALFFAVFHMNVAQGVYTFALGLYLAYLYYTTGSLWLVTMVHAINNLYAVLIRLVPESVLEPAAIVILILGLVGFSNLIRVIKDNQVQWTALPEPMLIEDEANDQHQNETSSEEIVDTI